MMYLCYVCGNVLTNFANFRTHINNHAWDCELPRPIKCLQDNCRNTFEKTYNFFRHVSSFHSSSDALQFHSGNTYSTASEMCDVGDNDATEQQAELDIGTHSVNECQKNVETEGIALVASLRANSSIPYSVLPQIVRSFNDMSSSIVKACKTEAMNCLSTLTTGGIAVDKHAFSEQLNSGLSKFEEPLDFLASRHKLDSFFSHHRLFVPPETVCFKLRFETNCGKTKPVYDTFQYVSVEETVKSLLRNDQFSKTLFQCQTHNDVSDVIAHSSDGEQAKRKVNHDGSSVQIDLQLFYDGMGTTNPLRGQSGMCTVGVFYYTIKNLPDSWNTCYANVHLLALCYACDLKYHGFSAVLDKFTAEICRLSTDGFDMDFPLTGKQTVKVNLCQVACDNLALNGVLGFIESFSGDYFCTLCYATRADSQQGVFEECFHLRTPHEYDQDVAELTKSQNGAVHVRGVKRACELNRIPGYHVTENFSNDVMHTLLEGTRVTARDWLCFVLLGDC